MNQTNKNLNFANIFQVLHWNQEMIGQISDGMWENASPNDHWRFWMNATVSVAKDDSELGRNFYARKDNYLLSSKDLLEIVGDRMIFRANILYRLPKAEAEVVALFDVELPEDVENIRFYERLAAKYPESGYAEKLQAWKDLGITQNTLDAVDEYRKVGWKNALYDYSEFRRDLAQMRKIIKRQF